MSYFLPATIKFKLINKFIDEQAAARIHRPEQIENVAIYRLITSETVEEWIYQRQVYKHNVAQHVLTDNHNDQRNLLKIHRHISPILTLSNYI